MNTIIGIQTQLQDLKNKRISFTDIGKALGTGRANISKRAGSNSLLTKEEIDKIENYFNVEINNVNSADTIIEEPTIDGDYYPDVFGSCGNGTFILSDNKEKIKIPERCFTKPISKVKKYSVINMYPTINDKDCLIIQHCENEPIQDKSIYVFCYDNQIFVKRLYHNIDEIMIKSDNPEFKTKFIQKEDMNNLILIGQVVGLMRDLR